jgi:hypothetical protein
VAAAVVLAFGFSLCRRGIVLSDEGYLLLQAVDMLGGKVLYRDMDSFVAPGVWFLLAGWFALVEPSVMASRLLALGCFGATALVLHRCVRFVGGSGAAAGAVAALLVFCVWAFPAWTFSFYSPYSVLFGLLALERLMAWRAGERRRDVLLAGVALGLAVVFKQNYGAFASAAALLGVLAVRSERRAPLGPALRAALADALLLALGGALVVLPLVAYFQAVGGLAAATESLVLHPFRGFLGRHDIAYLPLSELFDKRYMAGSGRLTYGAFAFTHTAFRYDWPAALVRGIELLHVLLYWLPLGFLAAGAALALSARDAQRRFDAGLLAFVAMAAFVFVGVLPRADFNHLMNVLQPVIGVAALVCARAVARARRQPRGAFALAAALAGAGLFFYAGVAAYWYVDLLRTLDSKLEQRRGGVLVSQLEQRVLDFEIDAIRERTAPGEAVLTLPAGSMFNFLAERPMPSRYYNLYAVHIAHDGGAGVVAGARAAEVRLAVADYDDFFSERVSLREYAPLLVDFLRREFQVALSIGVDKQLFLERREPPLPERATLDALADCDVDGSAQGARHVSGHLLFRSLHHALAAAPKGGVERVETRCRVHVPPGAELMLRVAYRQPVRLALGSELVAEVGAVDAAASPPREQLLLRAPIPIKPWFGWASPAGSELRVDLSRYADRDLELVFRSRFKGRIEMEPLDLTGFAMLWQDARLEYDGAGGRR